MGRRLAGPEGRWRVLSPLELRLVRALPACRGGVVGRQALLAAAGAAGCAGTDEELDQYIHYLRGKLEPDPGHPRYLLTVRGVGYRLRDPSEAS